MLAVIVIVIAIPGIVRGPNKPTKVPVSENQPSPEVLPPGIVRETGQCKGTITGHVMDYIVHSPAQGSHLPVFLHQYGGNIERTSPLNVRVASYGIFKAATCEAGDGVSPLIAMSVSREAGDGER